MNELIVIAGIVLIAIAIIGGFTGQFNIPPLSKRQRSALGIFGIIVLIIGVLSFPIPPPPPPPPTPTPTVTPSPTLTPTPFCAVTIEITDPKNGAEVSSPLTVEGAFDGELPEDRYLWLFVYDYEDWYPQNRIEPFRDEWHLKIWLGPATVGKELDIAVVLVDKDADSEFQRSRVEPFRSLPQGTQICDRITVEVR